MKKYYRVIMIIGMAKRETLNTFVKIIVVIFLGSLVSGCATTGLADYAKLEGLKADKVATTTLQMINSNNVESFINRQEFSTEIRQWDPVAQFDRYRSHFRIYKFHANQGERYEVNLRSLCQCGGFAKRILYPITMLIDSKGNIINDSPSTLKIENASWSLPMNVHSILNGQLEESGTYYVVVAAENQSVAKQVSRTRGFIVTSGVFAIIGMPVVSHPTGKLDITITVF